MDKKKQLLVSIGLVFLLVLMVMGVSYAAFTFIGSGERVNTITTGVISMEYKESSNVISINKALPTTDATGKKRLTEGEYFDFTVLSNIKGSTAVNYEIAAEDVTSSTAKKIDGSHIKLYLTKINSDGTETEVMAPKTFKTSSANQYTGKPSGMMSLERNTIGEAFNTKYRLRMYVDENYNPQGDGGNLKFSIRINVYGKVTSESMPQGGFLRAYTTEADFHTTEYKKKITSITTKKDNVVPATAIESWDVSEDQDKSVMAYAEDDGTGAGTYKLTIGGRNGIIANESMESYFLAFTNVKTIDLSNLDTSFTTNMGKMFYECEKLTNLNLSKFNTSNVTDMNRMFQGCKSFTNIDLSSFNTSKVTNMFLMFSDCSNLLKLDLSNFDTSNVSSVHSMFMSDINLSDVNLSGFDFTNVNAESSHFSFARENVKVNLSNSKILNKTSKFIADLIDGAYDVDFSNADFSDSVLTNIFKTAKKVNFTNANLSNTNMSYMFNGDLEEINLKDVKTTGVTDMSYAFYCVKLSELDLSSFDTSSVTNMYGMFLSCRNLLNLDLSSFDTSNVTNMGIMFLFCNQLTNINLKSFNTSKVTNMESMFNNDSSLTSLDLSNFDTSNVVNMSAMFNQTTNLKNIDLKNFNTSNVTNMSSMFASSSNLTSLNLSSFNTSKVTNMNGMFYGNTNLTNIKVSNKWVIGSTTTIDNMFTNSGTDHVTVV